MAKDKKKKRNKLKTFLSLAAIFIACFLIYAASSDLMMTMKLKDEITSSEEMIKRMIFPRKSRIWKILNM